MKECQNCGRGVTEKFAKVYGDNEDVLQNCPSCIKEEGYRKNLMFRGGCAKPDLEKLQEEVASIPME